VPRVEYDGVSCDRRAEESVLDAILRGGVTVSHSCKAGSCGSCLMRAKNPAALPPAAQRGLKDAWKASGYFLACVCLPDGDLEAGPVSSDARTQVAISRLDRLSESVLRVGLVSLVPFDYRPGQYLTLLRQDGLARSYSIASLPDDGEMELHVRVLPEGRMSQWLATSACVGASLEVQGPFGDCFYVPGREDQPIVLAGTGTGLAPLYGIAREALRAGHHGPVHLFHGATVSAGLYLRDELAALTARYDNFTYTPTVLATDGPIERVILGEHAVMSGWRAFLCGDPSVVKTLRRAIFIGGAAMNDIHADAFLPSAGPAVPAPMAVL
jgi:CDP-4-dehydro-6-deoxyglucose reductase